MRLAPKVPDEVDGRLISSSPKLVHDPVGLDDLSGRERSPDPAADDHLLMRRWTHADKGQR